MHVISLYNIIYIYPYIIYPKVYSILMLHCVKHIIYKNVIIDVNKSYLHR